MHDTPVYQVLGGDSDCHKEVTVLSSGDGTGRRVPVTEAGEGQGLYFSCWGCFKEISGIQLLMYSRG